MSINFKDALKAKKLRDFFNEKGRVYILVDATSDDVLLPDSLKGDPALPLVLNARMPQPIYIRDSFLESNFSFAGVSHHCVIPMSRIWATYLPEHDLSSGIVWDDAMPEMVKLMLQEANKTVGDEGVNISSVKHEKSVPSKKGNDGGSSGAGRKVGHLRVIK